MKIGILGGSFDPVHFGHLTAAQDALEQLSLDRLILVPAAQAPLKPADVRSSAEDRLAMLRAAVGGDSRFEISDFEIRKGGISYTIDTVRYFRLKYPTDQLYWVIGGDQLAKLPLWRGIEELGRMIEFICLERPGHASEARPAIPGVKIHRCPGHQLEISSTELRERIRKGLPVDFFIPNKAVEHIEKRLLYR